MLFRRKLLTRIIGPNEKQYFSLQPHKEIKNLQLKKRIKRIMRKSRINKRENDIRFHVSDE